MAWRQLLLILILHPVCKLRHVHPCTPCASESFGCWPYSSHPAIGLPQWPSGIMHWTKTVLVLPRHGINSQGRLPVEGCEKVASNQE